MRAANKGRDHTKGHTMRAIYPSSTGHRRLADGSLLRIDVEMGRWVGRIYAPRLTVITQIVGSDVEVHAWADKVAA